MSFDTQNGAEFVTLNKNAKLEGGDGALQFTTAGENSIRIPDNQASALIIEEAGNAYMTFVTTDDDGDDETNGKEETINFNKSIGSQFIIADGSAGAPAIARVHHDNDSKSGIYFTDDIPGGGKGSVVISASGAAQFYFTDGFMKPVTDNDINLGSLSNRFKEIHLKDQIKYYAENNNRYVAVKPPADLSGTWTLTFPDDNGDADEVLITNGSGVTSWGTVNTANITADAIDATKIADDAISEEHLDPTVISALTAVTPVAGDYVMILDADDGALKKALVEEVGPLSRPEAPGTPNSSSDRRFKKNISTVSGALQKLSKLNPVNYDWRQDEFEHKGFGDKKQWGFIAQEIKEIFPELVGKDDEDFLTLNYQGFVPLLTKAVQEQQEEIDSQQKEIDALKSQLQMIMDMLDNDMSDKTDSKKDNDNKKPVKLSMATQK
jgi:hypothetical protein